MRRISAMYAWSGGMSPGHTCGECQNCRRFQEGRRAVYKCMAYGNTNSTASDWRVSYMACKYFDKPCPPLPERVAKTDVRKTDSIPGQLTIWEMMR